MNDKTALFLGLAGVGAAYMGLDAIGAIDSVCQYMRMTPNSGLAIKDFMDGAAMLATSTGAIGAVGSGVESIAKKGVGHITKNGPKYLEGAVDSGMAMALIGTPLFRDKFMYEWGIYGPRLEEFLDSAAGVATVGFLVAFAGAFLYGVGNKIDKD